MYRPMFPREHLPLTLVTVALLGMLFIMYRELNALKSAVAHLSTPVTIPLEDVLDEEPQVKDHEDVPKEEKSPSPALNSSKKTKSVS